MSDISPRPNPSLIDLPDKDLNIAVNLIVNKTFTQGFSKVSLDNFQKLDTEKLGVFRMDFLQSVAKISDMKLVLKPDAESVHVK